MIDYYNVLGLSRSASADEIKKAYRSMAMKHHPDRGGNEDTFKKINEAYDVLSDAEKKQMFDMGGDPNSQSRQGGFNQGPFEFHFGSGNFQDIFGQFGFGGRRPTQANKTFNIVVELSLEEVLTGKDINAEVSVPGNMKKNINISIPPGIEHGQQIRYQGLGDSSISHLPAGDLIINVRVKNHNLFRREGSNLILEKKISVWDALLGTKIDVATLGGKNLEIVINAGTQSETVLSCKGEGLPHIKTHYRGNLLIKIIVEIPKTLSKQQKQLIESIKNAI